VPGSPGATTTISGEQLPPPPPKFGGTIRSTTRESKPYWPARVVPPKGAPNVLLIMTDDSGYGVPSTFGGVIPTPALDRVANHGLRYTNFHSTALCSPTRAALITGRNHHSVGYGVIAEAATGYPGYDSFITKDKATIGKILKDNGYRTSWFGKNHNTPAFQASAIGPFDQWPTGMGFEYFYGFMGGDTSQWQPANLARNTTYIYPFQDNPGFNLITAMADDAIAYMNQVNTLTPDQPFFVYYVPGASHAPHHPTKEWVDRISKMKLFDQGWNKLRDQIFDNQKRLGVIPANAKLTPWPKDLLKEWDQLTDDERKLFIRQAEVFAAFVAYTDHEIGRVIQAVEDMGKLDNTLVIYINGDNGTSSEGQLNGSPNEVAMFNSIQVPVDVQLKNFYDDWGTEKTYNHMAAGWAWAFNTPFSWVKQVASHFGGTKQGMAISWPKVITDQGGIRHQFHHVIDIVPTILEASAIKPPTVVDGIRQAPIEGVSMNYTFDRKNAGAPSTHSTQYFEMMGDHAIYHDGWIASTKVMRPPWNMDVSAGVGNDPSTYPWELFDLRHDWTQSDDLAARYPAKGHGDAGPFHAGGEEIPGPAARRIGRHPHDHATSEHHRRAQRIYLDPAADRYAERRRAVGAQRLVPFQGGDRGAAGRRRRHADHPGRSFRRLRLLRAEEQAGLPVNLVDLERIRWEGPELTPGKHVLEFDFKYEGMGFGTIAFGSVSGIGRGGVGELKVDGQVVATRKMAHTLPITLAWDENLDVGSDTGTPVNDQDYQVPFAFTGQLKQVTLTIDRPQLSPADIKALQQASRSPRE
jgi:arylsulfatase A-like enzyme